jgi:CBS domain-containing protein
MTREVLVTWPDEPLIEATDRMLSHSVHRLVVVESEGQRTKPVGILSLTDLTRAGMNDLWMETK